MGKKSKNKSKQVKQEYKPRVSICTPTFNRRPFFEGLIQCISSQDYPRESMEWIIVDDGTDCVKDIFESEMCKNALKGIQVRYFYVKERMDLGKKRNYMHEKCLFKNDEDIIVYMDDDDYYPVQRVSHSVQKLTDNKKALCGGASELYLWFNVLNKMYKFGPYGPNHATAGTFAFKRKLLNETSYQDDAVLSEERHFLKNYTVPFVQFDPLKTILVVAHNQNTFDKRRLINDKNKYCKESTLTVKHFIKNENLCTFYHSKINEILKDYEPGEVKNKPKVLAEIARRDKAKKDEMDNKLSGIIVTNKENKQKELTIKEVKEYMDMKNKECSFLRSKLNEYMSKIKQLETENRELKMLSVNENKVIEILDNKEEDESSNNNDVSLNNNDVSSNNNDVSSNNNDVSSNNNDVSSNN